jgi:hypothetical protein
MAHLNGDNRAFLASIGTTIANVGPDERLYDVQYSYAEWFAGQGYKIALSRPDFYLFAAVGEPRDLDAMIDGLRSAWLPAAPTNAEARLRNVLL